MLVMIGAVPARANRRGNFEKIPSSLSQAELSEGGPSGEVTWRSTIFRPRPRLLSLCRWNSIPCASKVPFRRVSLPVKVLLLGNPRRLRVVSSTGSAWSSWFALPSHSRRRSPSRCWASCRLRPSPSAR